MARRRPMRQRSKYEQEIVQIKRVSKTTKGGRSIGFTALCIAGDRKGKIGYGLGKAKDVATAIQKGFKKAEEAIVDIKIEGDSIPHEIRLKYKSAKILLKPAPKGSGIIAGGAMRTVFRLVGVKNISAKMLGSNNKLTNIRAAIKALQMLKTGSVVKED